MNYILYLHIINQIIYSFQLSLISQNAHFLFFTISNIYGALELRYGISIQLHYKCASTFLLVSVLFYPWGWRHAPKRRVVKFVRALVFVYNNIYDIIWIIAMRLIQEGSLYYIRKCKCLKWNVNVLFAYNGEIEWWKMQMDSPTQYNNVVDIICKFLVDIICKFVCLLPVSSPGIDHSIPYVWKNVLPVN